MTKRTTADVSKPKAGKKKKLSGSTSTIVAIQGEPMLEMVPFQADLVDLRPGIKLATMPTRFKVMFFNGRLILRPDSRTYPGNVITVDEIPLSRFRPVDVEKYLIRRVNKPKKPEAVFEGYMESIGQARANMDSLQAEIEKEKAETRAILASLQIA